VALRKAWTKNDVEALNPRVELRSQ